MISFLRIIVFQSLWFLFAYWGTWDYQYLVPIIALISVILDWKLANSQITFRNLIIFLIFLLICGVMIDSILFHYQWILTQKHHHLSPMNMWGFWIIFAPYYDFAFDKFKQNKLLAIVFALIGAPMAYQGGSKLANFDVTQVGFILIAILWGIFFPLSLHIYYKKLLRT